MNPVQELTTSSAVTAAAPTSDIVSPATQKIEPGPEASTECEPTEYLTVMTLLPDFWHDLPQLWFAYFESMTKRRKLSDKIKYNLVITKLDKDAMVQVSDILLCPSTTNNYQILKKTLLKVYEKSETELGYQKPSQLLRRMKNLAGGELPDCSLKIFWFLCLPQWVQDVLAATELSDLNRLSEIADIVTDAIRATERAAEVIRDKNYNNLLNQIEKLRLDVAELQQDRARQRRQDKSPQRYAYRSNSRHRETSSSQENANRICYIHRRYGANANRCQPPCNWTEQ